MPDMKIKNVAKLFAVLLLSQGDQCGYDMIKGIERRLGSKASPGQIYPFLKQLKKYGYIDSKGKGERDKQVYHLTPAGKKFVGRLSDRFGEMFEIAIKPKLITCAHCGCEIYKGAYKAQIGGKSMYFCCENCAKSYKTMTRLR